MIIDDSEFIAEKLRTSTLLSCSYCDNDELIEGESSYKILSNGNIECWRCEEYYLYNGIYQIKNALDQTNVLEHKFLDIGDGHKVLNPKWLPRRRRNKDNLP